MPMEARLAELNLALPPAPSPGGIYAPVLIVGQMVYVSGHGPLNSDGSLIKGQVGATLTLEQGVQAARQVGLTMLATLRRELGNLDRIQRVIKVLGMVNCPPSFEQHPQVINGFSQLMVDLLGDELGRGTRSAVGMGSLPQGIAVEVEAQFLLRAE